jgi:hypothetical protein
MANLFPIDIYPAAWEPDWDPYTSADSSADGYLQINAYDPVDQFGAHGEWTIKRSQLDQLRAHRDLNKDRSFGLFDFWYTTASALFVAIADGASTVYTLPGREFASPVILHNGVAAATQPTFNAGAGEDGKTTITYTSGTKPANGVVIAINATDCRVWYEVFYKPPARWSPRHVEADVWNIKLDFTQRTVA